MKYKISDTESPQPAFQPSFQRLARAPLSVSLQIWLCLWCRENMRSRRGSIQSVYSQGVLGMRSSAEGVVVMHQRVILA